MITLYKYEGKTREEVLDKAISELNVSENDIYINEEETEAKLFKSKKFLIEVAKKEDVILYIKDYIADLSKNMGIDIKSEIREKENTITVLLVSSNNAILIGKDGKNLDALQLLLRQAVNNQTNNNIKLVVDASGYKSKKAKNLEYNIKKICYEVKKTKIAVKLDPMNSYERRIVHNVVGQFEELKSISEGTEPNRYTIISYKD